MPESWVVTGVVPGQFAILQSYPEDKYVGGEAREPGDTKCDLTIRPPDVSVAGIRDGDRVIVTGELRTAGVHTSLDDFWASKIEK